MKNKTLQEVYENSSDEVKEILESKFSSSDLGTEPIETQIRNEILKIIKNNIKNIKFLDKKCNYSDLPTPRFDICDENGKWLFNINYDEKTKHFWYSYNRVFDFFNTKYGIDCEKFNNIMRVVVEEYLKMEGVTPNHSSVLSLSW